MLIVGRQKGTESKARLPDNVTLGKDLQLSMLPPPHLEDEDNNICLRNIVISVTENTMQTGPGTQQRRGHAQGTPTCLAPVPTDPLHEIHKDPPLLHVTQGARAFRAELLPPSLKAKCLRTKDVAGLWSI